jgi:hypothetical protein
MPAPSYPRGMSSPCLGCVSGHPREWDRLRWPWQVIHRVPGEFASIACTEPSVPRGPR